MFKGVRVGEVCASAVWAGHGCRCLRVCCGGRGRAIFNGDLIYHSTEHGVSFSAGRPSQVHNNNTDKSVSEGQTDTLLQGT